MMRPFFIAKRVENTKAQAPVAFSDPFRPATIQERAEQARTALGQPKASNTCRRPSIPGVIIIICRIVFFSESFNARSSLFFVWIDRCLLIVA
eukprot:m.165930 g.165930  ORF g.165930 m.165930 type:complete len:93 (-) comp53129_c0_seq4:36-314(-)